MSVQDPESSQRPVPLPGATSSGVTATGGKPGSGGPTRPVVVRRYPKPPPLLRRTALLILKPEQWPAMARYPFWCVLIPLLLVIVIAAAATAVGDVMRAGQMAHEFAARYDEFYAPLIYQDGKLSKAASDKKLPTLQIKETPIVVDPTGATKLDAIPGEGAIFMDSDNVYIRPGAGLSPFVGPIKEMVPGVNGPVRINGAFLTSYLNDNRAVLAVMLGLFITCLSALSNVLWAGLVMLLMAPFVQIGARNLQMPRRVAFRIAAAVAIPLIALGGLLEALDANPANLIGIQASGVLWLGGAVIMAIWAGRMANAMYGPKRRKTSER